MISVVGIVVSLVLIVLMIGDLCSSALRAYRQQKNVRVAGAQVADTHGLALVQTRRGMMVSARKPVSRSPLVLPPSWYSRLRTYVSLSLLLMVLATFFIQRSLADGTLQSLSKGLTFFSASQFNAIDIQTASHVTTLNVSKQLVRISQLDPAQYNSSGEWSTWAYSACSTASMTEVFDAYGRNYRITDVLKVESQIGAITPQMGLLDPSGIQQTAAQFGFKTDWGNSWSLDRVINTANSGKPVIVGFPPDRYAGGHLLVVIGGDSNYVYLADSSSWNHRMLTHDQFLQWWAGYAAVVTPK
ncbi:MAG TPA: C39 family peptidase [Ktedonobacteraceae bacterium]